MARSNNSLLSLGIAGVVVYFLYDYLFSEPTTTGTSTIAVGAGSGASGGNNTTTQTPTGTTLIDVHEPLKVTDYGTISAGAGVSELPNVNVIAPKSNHDKVVYWLTDNKHIQEGTPFNFHQWNYVISEVVGFAGPSPESVGLDAAAQSTPISWKQYYDIVGPWWNI